MPPPPSSSPRRRAVLSAVLPLFIFTACFALARLVREPSWPPTATNPPSFAQPAKTASNVAAPSEELPADAAAPRSSSVRQPIRDALEGDDPLASAEKMLVWLETTTAETFRQLAEAPEKFPTPRFSGFEHEFRSAYFRGIAERWLRSDPEGALPAMQLIEAAWKKQDGSNSGQLFRAVAALNPRLVLENLPLENKGGYLEPHARTALENLAAHDSAAAKSFPARWTEKALRKDALTSIARGVAASDPLAAAALAREYGDKDLFTIALRGAERSGAGMVREVLRAAGDQLGPYAISPDFLLRYPALGADVPDIPLPPGSQTFGAGVSEQAQIAADRMSPDERERFLSSSDSLPACAREGAIAAVVSAWARTEPKAAADWAVAHGKPEEPANSVNAAAQQAFLRWINNEGDAALDWWRALEPSPLRDALGTNASTFLAEEGRLTEAMEVFRPPNGESNAAAEATRAGIGITTFGDTGKTPAEEAAAHLAQILSERDPATAAAWFAKLPPSVATATTAGPVVTAWFLRDPAAVAHWTESLPAGAVRDGATGIFVGKAVEQSPADAAAWVETLTDPESRRKAAEGVFYAMRTDDPAGAREWLSHLDGVDPEWQERTLRRMGGGVMMRTFYR